MENTILKQAYDDAVLILKNARSKEEGLNNNIVANKARLFAQEQHLSNLPITQQYTPEIIATQNRIVALRGAIVADENELASLRNSFNQLQSNIDAAFETWVDWKEANMTPEELDKFQEIKQTIKERDAELTAKLKSGTFWQKYKSAIAITGGIIVLFLIAFLIYKYVKKNK